MNTTVRMSGARRALFVLLLLSLTLPAAAAKHARNVILMIGDGMGPSQVELARNYSAQILKQPLQIAEVAAAGRMGISFTCSANALVTDSAAGATAFAIGQKTNNGMVSVTPDGKSLPTILELARDHGMRTGIVVTATVTDATPACFASHVSSRSKDQDIAAQMLADKPDVLLGGGTDSFLPKAAGGHRDDDRNLETEARAAGYTVVGTRQELAKASGKVIGLFGSGNLSSELVREQESPDQPSLAEMTDKALQLLSRDKRGFFLMVEGSQIDKRCHANDTTGALHETLAFDEAVGRAFDFARRHGDTLLIITADHETGGMAFSGSLEQLQALAKATALMSGDSVADGMTAAQIAATAQEKFGITLSEAEIRSVLGDGAFKRKTQYNALIRLGSSKYGVNWGCTGHSASPVFLIGYGPGSEAIRGVQENTAVFNIMRKALDF